MKNNIKGLELYHPYILNLVPYIAIFFIVRLIAGDEWEWGGFWLVIGLMFAWSLFKEITRAIYFHIFIKKQTINNLVSEFEENNFPEPDELHTSEPKLYLESVIGDKDLYPQNIIATSLSSELSYMRSTGNIFGLFRTNNIIKKSLVIYRLKQGTYAKRMWVSAEKLVRDLLKEDERFYEYEQSLARAIEVDFIKLREKYRSNLIKQKEISEDFFDCIVAIKGIGTAGVMHHYDEEEGAFERYLSNKKDHEEALKKIQRKIEDEFGAQSNFKKVNYPNLQLQNNPVSSYEK